MQIQGNQPYDRTFFPPPPTGYLKGSSKGITLIPPSRGAERMQLPLTKEAEGRLIIHGLATNVFILQTQQAPFELTRDWKQVSQQGACCFNLVNGELAKEIHLRNELAECWDHLRQGFQEYYNKLI